MSLKNCFYLCRSESDENYQHAQGVAREHPLVTSRDWLLIFKVLLLFGTSWISEPFSFSTADPWQISLLLYGNRNSKWEKFALLTPNTQSRLSKPSEINLDGNLPSPASKIYLCQAVFHAIVFKSSSWSRSGDWARANACAEACAQL